MIQTLFFFLLVVTLIVGYLAYHPPSTKNINPMKYAMDNTGYTTEQSLNSKRTQEINMATTKGIMKVRKMLDDLAVQQSKILDTLEDQRQILDNTSKDANAILREAKQKGVKGNKDLLQLETLTKQLDDEKGLMVNRGQELLAMNDQLTKSRNSIAEQVSLANINTDSALLSLHQSNIALNSQSAEFFGEVNQHNQELNDRIGKINTAMQGMVNNAGSDSFIQQQGIEEHIQSMMDREHENMLRLAECEEKSTALMSDARQNIEDAQMRLRDAMQRIDDQIQDEHQKEQDQQDMIQQRIADQEQRIKDRQDQQNH